MSYHPQGNRVVRIIQNLKENDFKFSIEFPVEAKQVTHDVYHTMDEGKRVTIAFFVENETTDVVVSLVVSEWLNESETLATMQARERATKN